MRGTIFSQNFNAMSHPNMFWRMSYSGMLHHVVVVRTDVSKGPFGRMFRLLHQGEKNQRAGYNESSNYQVKYAVKKVFLFSCETLRILTNAIIPSFGMWFRLSLVWTDVSGESIASILRGGKNQRARSVADSSHPDDGGGIFLRNALTRPTLCHIPEDEILPFPSCFCNCEGVSSQCTSFASCY
jgi:hypothetical protein